MKNLKVFMLNSIIMVTSSIILQMMKLIFNIYISNQISREALGTFQLIMSTYLFGITLAASRNKYYNYKDNIRRNCIWKQ